MICMYHGVDLDGQCSAAIVLANCIEQGIDCKLIPMDYGYAAPWDDLADQDVVMVDFSVVDFFKLCATAKSVVWIDHHVTAIEGFKDFNSTNLTKEVRTDHAACLLTWCYYHECEVPLSVQLLSQYDIWDHRDSRVLPFQYGMRTLDTRAENQEFWCNVFTSDNFVNEMCEKGQIILDYQDQLNEDTIKRAAYKINWEGEEWWVCNSTLKGSKVFDSLDWDGGVISYYWTHHHWTVSLYNSPNCGAIAKRYGGGGHAYAAGFRCEFLPMGIMQ